MKNDVLRRMAILFCLPFVAVYVTGKVALATLKEVAKEIWLARVLVFALALLLSGCATSPRNWGVPVERCVWCGSTHNLNVHHIIPQHIRPDLAHDPRNMIVLCRECHYCLGHRHDWRSPGVTNIVRMIEEGRR